MTQQIPQALIAVVAQYIAMVETHASLDALMLYAGAPGDPPEGSKLTKAQAWLRRANKLTRAPLAVLGRVVEGHMEMPLDEWNTEKLTAFRATFRRVLEEAGLQYLKGGVVSPALASPTRTLEAFVSARDVAAITEEFDRAAKKADSEPREAVSAAANILESICKHYVQQRGLDMPTKQVLSDLWSVVRKDLGFDPSQVADDDLKTVLTGLIQTVQGLGAFRTHASSAHGAGPKSYRLEPRHSRLAVHAAHTVALFIFETWEKRDKDANGALASPR